MRGTQTAYSHMINYRVNTRQLRVGSQFLKAHDIAYSAAVSAFLVATDNEGRWRYAF